ASPTAPVRAPDDRADEFDGRAAGAQQLERVQAVAILELLLEQHGNAVTRVGSGHMASSLRILQQWRLWPIAWQRPAVRTSGSTPTTPSTGIRGVKRRSSEPAGNRSPSSCRWAMRHATG